MTELQTKILSLLEEVDDICRRNDIEYYLEGGAILGAIRHGGFLPWDDDSDITMTRSNWEKFREVFFRDKPQNRALESPELNDMYPTNTVRYIDTSTTSIWRSLMYDVCACGVFVDIFILEDAPDDDEQLEQMKRDFIDYCEIINPFYRLSSLGDGERFRHHLKRSRTLGRRKVAEELNAKILQYHGQPSSRYLMRWGMRFQVYDKSVYGKPTYVPFENTMLPIPERPLDYLVYQYGIDWHMIPEASDVELHDTILDLNIGYRTYMDAYMPLINKEEALALNFKYKVADMEILDYNKAFHKHIYGTAGSAAALVLHRELERRGLDLEKEFSQVTPKNNVLFEELFGDYLTKQLHQWYLFYGVFVPIEDDVLSCIVTYLLRSGRSRQAEKLLNIRMEQKQPLSPQLEKAKASYDALVSSTKLFWSGHWAEAAQYLRNADSIVMTPTGIAICLIDDILTGRTDALMQIKRQTEDCVQTWPNEDLFKMAYVLVLQKLGFEKSATTVAQELLSASSNGMVIRTIQTDPLFESLNLQYASKSE